MDKHASNKRAATSCSYTGASLGPWPTIKAIEATRVLRRSTEC